MKKRYDFLYAGILILLLVVAYFVNNAVVRGVLLLLFSGAILFSIITNLIAKKNDRFRTKVFLGILLFLDSVLLLSSVYVLITSIIEIV